MEIVDDFTTVGFTEKIWTESGMQENGEGGECQILKYFDIQWRIEWRSNG